MRACCFNLWVHLHYKTQIKFNIVLPTAVFHPGRSWQDGSYKLQYVGDNTGDSLEKAGRGHTKRVTDKGTCLYKGTGMYLAGRELYRATWFQNYSFQY